MFTVALLYPRSHPLFHMRFELDERPILITSLLPLPKLFVSVSAPSVGLRKLDVLRVYCHIKTLVAVLDAITVSSELEEGLSTITEGHVVWVLLNGL